MKAPNFAYCKPGSLDEALELLSAQGNSAVPLAGGQSLVAGLNLRLSSPDLLVDLDGLQELRGIEDSGETIAIGAMTTHNEVARSAVVRRYLPLLARALRDVAHVAIRNRGTLGGSLAYADPAAEMPACCVALGASIVIVGRFGRREVAADRFYRGLFETDLKPGELIVQVRLPKQRADRRWGFAELSRRHGDFALAGVACLVEVRDRSIGEARLCYFGCTDFARLAGDTAQKLRGMVLPLNGSDWLAPTLAIDLQPTDSAGFKARTKIQLASTLTQRVLNGLNAVAAA